MRDRVARGTAVLGRVAVGHTVGLAVSLCARIRRHHDNRAVLVMQQNLVDQLFKIAVVKTRLDRGQSLFIFQITPRLITVEPAAGDLDVIVKALGQSRGVALSERELGRAQLGADGVFVKAVCDKLPEAGVDLSLDLAQARRVAVLQLDGKERMTQVLDHTAVDLNREAFFKDAFFQGVIVRFAEDIAQHRQRQ